MFFKKLKNAITIFLLTFFIIPFNVLAYSDYVIASGKNIGIELRGNGVIIVGTYEVDGVDIAKKAGLQVGDRIININNVDISSIDKMIEVLSNVNNTQINILYERNNNKYNTLLSLIKDDYNNYKTGLYVKDSINGVGTLTYIDPETKVFGALGHEIIEKSTGKKFEITNGYIYDAIVTGLIRSSVNNPGEKNAKYDTEKVYGTIKENTKVGIYGEYSDETLTLTKSLYKVGSFEDIKLGPATILTVINDNIITEFDINIMRLFTNTDNSKNILFEITDERLLEQTGGVIQGMSGSPIIQGDYIIGAVTHVVVSDPTKGYGIFITRMLEEGEN